MQTRAGFKTKSQSLNQNPEDPKCPMSACTGNEIPGRSLYTMPHYTGALYTMPHYTCLIIPCLIIQCLLSTKYEPATQDLELEYPHQSNDEQSNTSAIQHLELEYLHRSDTSNLRSLGLWYSTLQSRFRLLSPHGQTQLYQMPKPARTGRRLLWRAWPSCDLA